MSSQKKDKGDKGDKSNKRKGSRERPVKVSKYLPLEESESSESSRRSTPSEERLVSEGMELSPPTAAANPTSEGSGIDSTPSQSCTVTSDKKITETDSKGVGHSQLTEKGTFTPNFNPAGTSKTRGTSKSPSRPRSESKSPLKKIQQRESHTRKVEEKKRLLDHPDGELRVVLKPRPLVELKFGTKLSNEVEYCPDREPTDDESTSKSSVSEASSVSKATRDLIIDRDDDESKEPQGEGMTLKSFFAARVNLPPETPDDSDKESKSSEDSDKETKSKKKKK